MSVAQQTLRLASRGSRLALIQVDLAAAALRRARPGVEIETVIIETQGDRRPDVPATELSGQGWFTSEVEHALADGRADVAVHSAKDLPSALADGLAVSAYLARADARDALLSRDGRQLADLPVGATVATSSPRRAAMLLELNPGVSIVPIRGNVDSRLRRLDAGEVDALVLACAGLDRLGLGDRISQRFAVDQLVPSPAQGVIALQTSTDAAVIAAVAAGDDEQARRCVTAERALLVALGGGCLLPLGAHARINQGRLTLVAALSTPGGVMRAVAEGDADDAAGIGERLASELPRGH